MRDVLIRYFTFFVEINVPPTPCLRQEMMFGCALHAVNLCTSGNPLDIYLHHFESSYIDETKKFYASQAGDYLNEHGVEEYMKYVSNKCIRFFLFL